MRDESISYARAAYEYDSADDPSFDDSDEENSGGRDDWDGCSDGFETID